MPLMLQPFLFILRYVLYAVFTLPVTFAFIPAPSKALSSIALVFSMSSPCTFRSDFISESIFAYSSGCPILKTISFISAATGYRPIFCAKGAYISLTSMTNSSLLSTGISCRFLILSSASASCISTTVGFVEKIAGSFSSGLPPSLRLTSRACSNLSCCSIASRTGFPKLPSIDPGFILCLRALCSRAAITVCLSTPSFRISRATPVLCLMNISGFSPSPLSASLRSDSAFEASALSPNASL
ncbi:Uncharacterised protein [uncultured archaeon]|nr:Uncharacterised protein [uncultured archaeon]